jgi:hypothetical protein
MKSEHWCVPPFAVLQLGKPRMGSMARAVMEVVLLEAAKNPIVEIRGIRTLAESLDRRKARQTEGGA